jgi:hypothetical protein
MLRVAWHGTARHGLARHGTARHDCLLTRCMRCMKCSLDQSPDAVCAGWGATPMPGGLRMRCIRCSHTEAGSRQASLAAQGAAAHRVPID